MDKKNEDRMLVVFILIGLVGGALLYFLKNGQPLSAIFMTFALSSILYRFLGGIGQSTKFSVGAFRLGGSAAFMIGCIFFINEYIFLKPAVDSVILSIPKDRWIPVKYPTGEFEVVKILAPNGDTIIYGIENSEIEALRKREFCITKEGNNYYICSNVDSTVIGHLKFEDLFKVIENDIKLVVNDFRVFKLYPNPTNGPNDKEKKYKSTTDLAAVNNTFPLIVEVDKTNMNIKTKGDSLLTSDVPRSEKFYLINVDQNYFVVCVLHANFETAESKWYSEFLIGKLSINR